MLEEVVTPKGPAGVRLARWRCSSIWRCLRAWMGHGRGKMTAPQRTVQVLRSAELRLGEVPVFLAGLAPSLAVGPAFPVDQNRLRRIRRRGSSAEGGCGSWRVSIAASRVKAVKAGVSGFLATGAHGLFPDWSRDSSTSAPGGVPSTFSCSRRSSKRIRLGWTGGLAFFFVGPQRARVLVRGLGHAGRHHVLGKDIEQVPALVPARPRRERVTKEREGSDFAGANELAGTAPLLLQVP